MIRKEYEKSLKRFLKRKVSYSFALLISFLITGEIVTSAELNGNEIVESNRDFTLVLQDIRAERELIVEKIKENEERIKELEKETTALIKEGDYYAKTLDKSRQFFFPLTYEHHHGKESGNQTGNDDEDKPTGEENVPPIIDKPDLDYPDINVNVGIDIPDINIDTVPPEEIVENIVIPDREPSSPEVDIDVNFEAGGELSITLPDVPGNIGVEEVTGPNTTDIKPITLGGNVPGATGVYVPRALKSPEKIADINMGVPDTPVSKGLEIGGVGYNVTKYYQYGAGVGTGTKNEKKESSSAPTMFQNVLDIDTNGGTFKIDLTDKASITLGEKGLNVIFPGTALGADNVTPFNKEVNNFLLTNGSSDLTKVLTNLNNEERWWSYEEELGDNPFHNIINSPKGFALILDTVAKDTTVSGSFDINFSGDSPYKKLFMLTSGVGIRNSEVQASTGQEQLDKNGKKNHVKVAELKKESIVNLYNTNSNEENFLVGIEHQTFDEHFINDRSGGISGQGSPFLPTWNAKGNYKYYDEEFRNSYTVFLNSGTLNLNGGDDPLQANKNNGKNVFGVIITHEYGAPETITTTDGEVLQTKNYNNVTVNNGEINVNGSSSIGMSFETYIHDGSGKSNNFIMRDDTYVGKMNVRGDFAEAGGERKGNYGFRMTNVLTESTRLPLSNGKEKEMAGKDAAGIAHNRFLERYWGKNVTNEDIVYMLAKWNDHGNSASGDFFLYFLGDLANGADANVEIKQENNGENNQYFSEKMGVKLTETTEIEVTNRIINDYKTYYDKVNIYGGGIVNIADAFADDKNIAGHFKDEDTLLTDEEIKAEREKGIYRNKYGQVEKIEALKVKSDMQVSGANNVGVVIEKSLSSNAKEYEGAKSGTVNGIDNVHRFNITVGGKYNVGFLRGALSSSNNTNDFIIKDDSKVDLETAEETLRVKISEFNEEIERLKGIVGENADYRKNEKTKEAYDIAFKNMEEAYKSYKDELNKTSAIDTIKFADGAGNSSLIRSDKYGITLEKDLNIDYFKPEETKIDNKNKISKNIVLHASTAYAENRDREIETGIHLTDQVTFEQKRGWANIREFLETQKDKGTLNDIDFIQHGSDKGQTITCKMNENFWKTYDSKGNAVISEESSVLADGKNKFDEKELFTLKDFNNIIKAKRDNIAELEEVKKGITAENDIKQIDKAIAQLKNDILYLDLYYKEGKGEGDTATLFAQIVDAHQNGYYDNDGNFIKLEGHEQYINTGGSVTNKAEIKSEIAGLVGMMANGTVYVDKDGKAIEDDTAEGAKLNTSKDGASKVYNYGQINLAGNESMGMAVMGLNYGYLGKEKTETDRASISVKYQIADDHDTTHSDDGKYSIGVYNEGKFEIDDALITADGRHAIGIYNQLKDEFIDYINPNADEETITPGTMNLNNLDIELDNGAIGIYSSGGKITGEDANITNKEAENKEHSVGVYAFSNEKQTADITLNNSNIYIAEGGSAVASVGEGSSVTLKDTDIYYSGNGYALFTDKNDSENKTKLGKITLGQGSTLTLAGSAVGFKWDTSLESQDQSILFDVSENSNEKIKVVLQDNSALLHLVNTKEKENAGTDKEEYNVSTMLSKINDQVDQIFNKVEIPKEQGIADTAKLAIVDGGILAIDKSISQSVEEYDKDGNQTPDFFFFKRFLGQRLQVTVNDGITVDSSLSTEEAKRWFNGNVVGLEMSSSSFASSKDETGITLKNGASVIANRTGAGTDDVSNTIGLYINYGNVKLEGGSTVQVENMETADDHVFANGIGVFAVNGSSVKTEKNSKIDVYGDKGIGIYASAFRTGTDGKPILDKDGNNEFGGKYNNIEIVNEGDITVRLGGVGIFADNNGEKSSSSVKNTGIIKAGGVYTNPDEDGTISAVGIYGRKTSISNEGIIEIGSTEGIKEDEQGGIGIYASEGSVVTSAGTIKIGDYSTGIVVDDTSKIELADKTNNTITFSSLYDNEASAVERMGIFYYKAAETDLARTETQVIDFNIDGMGLDKLKAVTGQNINITLAQGHEININGNSSRGIRIDNGIVINEGTINIGTASTTTDNPQGTEELNTGSIGIAAVGEKAVINNEKGVINVYSDSGVGIYLDNRGKDDNDKNTIAHAGKINLAGKDTVGVLLKNTRNENKFTIDINEENLSSINFGETGGQIGVYTDGQNINLVSNIERELNNTGQDILLYANGGAKITNNSAFTIKGTFTDKDQDRTNKSIGIYLAGGSDFIGTENSSVTVESGAIGIYTSTKQAGKEETQSKTTELKDVDINVVGDTDRDAKGTTIGIVVDGRQSDSQEIGQEISGNINISGKEGYKGHHGVGMFVDSAEVKIGTKDGKADEKDILSVNMDNGDNIGIYLTGKGTLTDGQENNSADTKNKVVLSKENKPDKAAENKKLVLGVYYSGRDEAVSDTTENNIDIEIKSDSMVGISSVKGMKLVNNRDITFSGTTADYYTVGAYAGKNSEYTQGSTSIGTKISLKEGGIGIYSEGTAVLEKGSSIEITEDENIQSDYAEIGMYAKGNGTIENKGKISVVSDDGIGMFISGAGDTDSSVNVINKGTIEISGDRATGVYIKDGHGFDGKDGIIKVSLNKTPEKAGDKSPLAVGILLNNAQTLTEAGKIYLQGRPVENTDEKGHPVTNVVGVYSKNTNVKANIDISQGIKGYNNHGIALAAETDSKENIVIGSNGENSDDYMKISIGDNSIGAYLQDTGVQIKGLSVNSESTTGTSTGIFLKNYEIKNTNDANHPAYKLSNADITMNSGTGIVLSAPEGTNSHVDLNLGNSNITINGKNSVGIYSERGNVRLTGGNTFNITDSIGIYVAEGGKVYVGEKSQDANAPEISGKEDIFVLSGNSIGVYAGKGGTITLGENADFSFKNNEGIQGNYAYTDNGTIINKARKSGKALEVLNGNGIIGKYSGTETASIENYQDIKVVGTTAEVNRRGIGIAVAADKNSSGNISGKTITSLGNISVTSDDENSRAIGIYSEAADIITKKSDGTVEKQGTITLENNSVGVYYNGFYSGTDNKTGAHKVVLGDITVNGSNNKAVILRGDLYSSEIGKITKGENAQNNTGVIIRDTQTAVTGNNILPNIELKGIELGDGSMGVYLENASVTFAGTGTIKVGNSVKNSEGTITDRAVGIMANNSDISLTGIEEIEVGESGIGVYALGGNINIDLTDPTHITVGQNGIYFYADNGANINIKNVPEKESWTIDGYTGIVLKDGSTIKTDNGNKLNINVTNGGTGIIAVNTPPTDLSDKVNMTVNGDNKDGKYSIGFIYKDIKRDKSISLIDVVQTGKHTIGNVVEGTEAEIIRQSKPGDSRYEAAITVGENASDSVGLMARDNSVIDVKGSIVVQGSGNIGMTLENSSAVVNRGGKDENGAVVVGSSDKENQNVGIYLHADKKQENFKGDYSLLVGMEDGKPVENSQFTMGVQEGSIGIIGTDYNIKYFGNINVRDGAVGIASQSTDNSSEIVFGGNLTVQKAEDDVAEDKTSIGIFAKNNKLTIGSDNISADVSVIGNKDFGIVSEDRGDIDFNGTLTVDGENSAGIYKLGGQNDTINLSGTMNIGEKGFGLIASSKEKNSGGYELGSVTVNNNADITLGNGAVGIHSIGQNTVVNNAEINVGETITEEKENGEIKNRFSAGIYAVNTDWSEESTIINKGTVNAVQKGSIGAITLGNTDFVNKGLIEVDNLGAGAVAALGGEVFNSEEGTINVNGGGAGLQAIGKSGITDNISKAYNRGTINVGLDDSSESAVFNVGMEARDGGKIINDKNGDINVYKGIGMYIDEDSAFENRGTVTVYDGIGIAGAGTIENEKGGNIIIAGKGSGVVSGVNRNNAYDTIIVSDDKVTLGENYNAAGGRIDAGDRSLDLNRVSLDVTKFDGSTPAFSGKDIRGSIKVNTNIILDRDETAFKIDGLFDTLEGIGDLDIDMSFLYDIKIDENLGLNFSKIDYSEFASRVEDVERNSIFDNIREGLTDVEADMDALKNLDYTISSIGSPEAGKEALNQYLGEMSGDIYNSTQRRMQDIQRAFENSFDEMETSYNFSKDTEKYSLIRTEGDYKHSKDNFINYEYNITGLMFMQEYEGTEYGNKWGYSGGFAVSKFKFEDSGSSEEDVYSLKAGVHNVKNFGNDLELLTKFEAGYNRHKTEKKVNYGYSYENSADINSYSLNFNNILRKKLYNDIENDLGVFAGFDLEYGRIHGFEEKGDVLPVRVESNDYMSARAEAGLNGTKRIYLDNDWTMKLTGKASYSYNFGDNYDNERSIRGEKFPVEVEEKEKGCFDVRAGIGFERLNYMGVTLEGQWQRDEHKDEDNWSAALRFNYKFGKINPTEPKKILKMEADNYFDFDKFELKPKGKEIIKKLAEFINTKKIKGVLTVEGHTDWTGTIEYNQKLSERRAEAIRAELAKYLTNPDIILETKGYGELYPIMINSTKEGRAANRRVEMSFRELSKEQIEARKKAIQEKQSQITQ